MLEGEEKTVDSQDEDAHSYGSVEKESLEFRKAFPKQITGGYRFGGIWTSSVSMESLWRFSKKRQRMGEIKERNDVRRGGENSG